MSVDGYGEALSYVVRSSHRQAVLDVLVDADDRPNPSEIYERMDLDMGRPHVNRALNDLEAVDCVVKERDGKQLDNYAATDLGETVLSDARDMGEVSV